MQGFLFQRQLARAPEPYGSNQVLSRFVYAKRVNTPDLHDQGLGDVSAGHRPPEERAAGGEYRRRASRSAHLIQRVRADAGQREPMDKQLLHDSLIAGGGLLFLFPLIAYACREQRRGWLTPLLQLLDGQVGEQKGIFAWTLRGRFNRRPVTIQIKSSGKYAKSFRFELLCPAGMQFVMVRERPLDGLRRTIGLLRDLKTGGELLDGEYVYRATDPERFRALLQDSSARHHVQVLFYDRHMHYVGLDKGVLWCGYGTGAPRAPDVGEVQQLLDALAALAESLEQQHDGRWAAEEPSRSVMPRGSHT